VTSSVPCTAVFLPSPGRTDAKPHGTNADAEVKAGCVTIVRASAVGEVVSRRIRRIRADSHTICGLVTGDAIGRPVTIERTPAIADIIAGGISVESPRVRVLRPGDAASDVEFSSLAARASGNVQMRERRGLAGERTIGRERLGRMASEGRYDRASVATI
jgi:hypothetical protein